MSAVELCAKVRKVARDDGLPHLALRSVGLIYRITVRRLLPAVGHTTYQGVRIPHEIQPEIRLFDRSLPRVWHAGLWKGTSSEPEAAAHRAHTLAGDHVGIIGGAWGVSTVVAARQVGPDGRVTVFEGSERYTRITSETARLNGVAGRCEVVHAVVGPEFGVYDGDLGEHVHPCELPECDVLEMDVEGSELEILRHLTIRPRVMIVEMHPRHGGYASPDEAYRLLRSMGYRVAACWKQDGGPLAGGELLDVLADPAAKPPIVAMIRPEPA